MAKRVMVFIDYQNVYKSAREAFNLDEAPHMYGQIDPVRLSKGIKALRPGDRELTAIHIYRGRPQAKHDAKGYDAFQRQIGIWEQHPLVTVTHRSIDYHGPRPKEKGIDVALAIDYVRCAIEDEYDIGVLFSGDTDLLPAIEMVLDKKGPAAVEVAAWAPNQNGRSPKALRVTDRYYHIHYLDEGKYSAVKDLTDYTAKRRRR